MKAAELAKRLEGVQKGTHGRYTARCPSHDDQHPSLSFRDGDRKLLIKCFAGCSVDEIAKALGMTKGKLLTLRSAHSSQKEGDSDERGASRGLTLKKYARAKRLRRKFLRRIGVTEITLDGKRGLRMPYRDKHGAEVAVRFRWALKGPERFAWKRGSKLLPYGLDRLAQARERGSVALVEGESDAQTLWFRGYPALGLPGAQSWRDDWARYFDDIRKIYVVIEPDAGGEGMLRWLSTSPIRDRVRLVRLDPYKDVSALFVARPHAFDRKWKAARAQAVPWVEYERRERERAARALRKVCKAVLKSDDPLALVKTALRRLGYGGSRRPALVVYLAATSRLLEMRPGAMPVHLLVLGVPSAGKSYTINLVLRLLPEETWHVIEAGSPRVLIYDRADLRHRVVIFAESDSLPAGEDNPAASALRSLLQEHRLRYQVTVRDRETGLFVVLEIDRPGPSVLITTAIKPLGGQLGSRVYDLEIPEDIERIRQALAMQAEIELHGTTPPDPALIAYQAYLQALAPWDVVIPFAAVLNHEIGRSLAAQRILRDSARLFSMIKAVTILRHRHRQRDQQGRLMATLEDYETVYTLVNQIYEDSVTGASKSTRYVVKAVKTLHRAAPVSVTQIAQKLGITAMSASRRVKAALKAGWLVNEEERRGHPFRLKVGEKLPEHTGLPSPRTLHRRRDEWV